MGLFGSKGGFGFLGGALGALGGGPMGFFGEELMKNPMGILGKFASAGPGTNGAGEPTTAGLAGKLSNLSQGLGQAQGYLDGDFPDPRAQQGGLQGMARRAMDARRQAGTISRVDGMPGAFVDPNEQARRLGLMMPPHMNRYRG